MLLSRRRVVVVMNHKVHLMLADAAQAVAGKLYILGGGWSVIVAGAPFALAIKIEVPYSRGTDKHVWKLSLVDLDGNAVLAPSVPDGEQKPIVFDGDFCTGIPPHITPGTPLDAVIAANFGPGIPLMPGTRYEWRFELDGDCDEDWCLGFTTAPAPLANAA
jgi:hypothetical protein